MAKKRTPRSKKPVKKKAAPRKRKPHSGQFAKGGPGGPGRPKGSQNKSKTAIAEFMREVLESPEYRESFKLRMLNGSINPSVEALAYHYAYGKPTETIDLGSRDDRPVRIVHEYHPDKKVTAEQYARERGRRSR